MVPIITLAVGLHLVIHKTLFLGKSKKYMSKFRDITDPKNPYKGENECLVKISKRFDQ